MFRGTFSAFLFYKVGAICAVLSLVIIYWQSQYYHHEPPFPKRTISQVAQHYPQYIIFRLSTVTGSAMIILGWFTNHFVLQAIALQHSINLRRYLPKVPLTLGTMAGMLLMGSTSLIDTGHMNESLHQFCASTFFILTFAAQIFNTIICILLQRRTRAFNTPNMYLKYFILLMLGVQLLASSSVDYQAGDDKGNFFEWTLTATVISMFLSMGLDASRFLFVFTNSKQQIQTQGRNELLNGGMGSWS